MSRNNFKILGSSGLSKHTRYICEQVCVYASAKPSLSRLTTPPTAIHHDDRKAQGITASQAR